MRALCSASVLANLMKRQLVVVWVPDIHLSASMAELFVTDGMMVLNSDPYERLPKRDIVLYDFDKGEALPIEASSKSIIFAVSPFRLTGVGESAVSDELFQACIASLEPNEMVRSLATKFRSLMQIEAGVTTVGMHVRMEGRLEVDVPGIYDLEPHMRHVKPGLEIDAQLERSKCDASIFVKKMFEVSRSHARTHFFASVDCNKAWDIISNGAKHGLDRPVHLTNPFTFNNCQGRIRRSAICVQAALAELLVLSEAELFIYSSWSSFSEIILSIRTLKRLPSILGCKSDEETFSKTPPPAVARASVFSMLFEGFGSAKLVSGDTSSRDQDKSSLMIA